MGTLTSTPQSSSSSFITQSEVEADLSPYMKTSQINAYLQSETPAYIRGDLTNAQIQAIASTLQESPTFASSIQQTPSTEFVNSVSSSVTSSISNKTLWCANGTCSTPAGTSTLVNGNLQVTGSLSLGGGWVLRTAPTSITLVNSEQAKNITLYQA